MVHGRASKPLGEITLPVQFGTASNYHVEHINFYIADFNTAYHTYLVLKMHLPIGVLDLRANLSVAYTYKIESLVLAEATDLSI